MGGSSVPKNTTQTTKPYWTPGAKGKEFDALNQMYNRQQNLYYDPFGNPRDYSGPDQAMRQFDMGEQMGYDRSLGMAGGGQAGRYAQNFAGDLYGGMLPSAQQNLRGAMSGQYATPKSQLQGADRMAAQNVEDILSGSRLDPNSNSAMQAVMDSVGRQVRKERGKATAGASAAFGSGGAGNLGGASHRRAQMAIEENMDRSIADTTAQLQSDFYNQGIQTQNALAQQMMEGSAQNRMGTAGSMYNLGSQYDLNRQYADADRLLKTGQFRRDQITDPNILADFQNQQRGWDWQQNAPMNQAQMIAMLQRGSGQTMTGTQTSPGMTGMQGAASAAGIVSDLWGAYKA